MIEQVLPTLRAFRAVAELRVFFIVGASLMSLAAHSGLPKRIEKLHLPGDMQVTVVADEMRVNGVDTRIYEFSSASSPDEIARHFSREWKGKMARSKAGPWKILSHREQAVLITVQMTELQSTVTAGYIAFSNVFAAARGTRPRPSVPVPSKTKVMQVIEAEDGGRNSETVVLSSELSSSQSLDFYRAYFRKEGYQPISSNALIRGYASGSMALNRGAQQANVSAVQGGATTIITIVLVGI